jgi:maleate isomerase
VIDDLRIGLIVPSSNTVMEVDLYRRLPERFHVHTARMFLEETTPEGESAMLDEHVMPAARDLGTARPHAVVFGCTSAGALRGNDYDVELCTRIAEVTGSETISTIASVREAIVRGGARRIGIVTPYVDALNERIRASIEADGVEVAGIHGLGIDENFAIAQVEPERIVAFATTAFGGSAIDLLFASCTNFRAFDAMDAIADALGAPVVTSNQAVVEAVLRRFGAAAGMTGQGERLTPDR